MSTRLATRLGNLRRLGGDLWRGGRGPVLLAVAGGWFLSLGVRMVYPAVLPQLRAAYGFDLTTGGILITVLWVAYALGQLPGGLLDDRLGGGRVLVASTLVSTLALVFVVTAPSLAVLFGATFLFGLATALYGVARFTILTDYFPDHSGTAVGLTMAVGDLGNTLLPVLGGALAVAFSWQAGFGVTIPLFLVVAAALSVAVPDGGRPTGGDSGTASLVDTAGKLKASLRDRSILTVTAVQTLGYWVWQAFTGFYPTYLVEVKGLAQTQAAVLFGAFFALGILVKPVAGFAFETYGIGRSLPVVLGAITATMVLLPFVEGLVALVALTALASSVLGYGTITLTYLADTLPDDVQGTGLGALRSGYMLVGAASPTVTGALADAGYFDGAFFLLAAVGAAAVLLSLRLPRDGRRE